MMGMRAVLTISVLSVCMCNNEIAKIWRVVSDLKTDFCLQQGTSNG